MLEVQYPCLATEGFFLRLLSSCAMAFTIMNNANVLKSTFQRQHYHLRQQMKVVHFPKSPLRKLRPYRFLRPKPSDGAIEIIWRPDDAIQRGFWALLLYNGQELFVGRIWGGVAARELSHHRTKRSCSWSIFV